MPRFALRLSLAALAAVALCTSRPAAADRYDITDLGTLPGFTFNWTWQQTINKFGVVAAYANNTPDPNAFSGDASYLWADGVIFPLTGLPGAVDTVAFSLNNRGQVVGRSTVPGAPNQPVLWDNGVIQALPELPGDNKGAALTINDDGRAVGYSQNTGTGFRHAVTWFKGKIAQLPPRPGGGMWDEALGINEEGRIVGFSGPAPGLEHIALWADGKVRDLGTLGGDWGDGYAINNRGLIVGQSTTATGEPDAFLWENGVLSDLGTFGSDVTSVALSINNKGHVVGASFASLADAIPSHALLWEHGTMIDLQTRIPSLSGWTLLGASGINDRGQIDGIGIHNGQFRNFVLTPVSHDDDDDDDGDD